MALMALAIISLRPLQLQSEAPSLFLPLGLPIILIRHENGAFRKRSSNQRNLKTPALRFSVDEKKY